MAPSLGLLLTALLGLCCLTQSQDTTANCRAGAFESHGKAILFLQQLRPINVLVIKHLAVEICQETKGNFYFQVWRNETTGSTPEFKLIWQYLVDREDPTQIVYPNNVYQSLFTIPERLQLDLSALTPAHRDRIFFGVAAPLTPENPTGKVPIRRYFSPDSQSLSSQRFNDTGQFTLGETRQFIELYWPYFFRLSLCPSGDINECMLPSAPVEVQDTCGIPGRVLSNVTSVPFRAKVKAVMVDFCTTGASLEVVLLSPVPGQNETTYTATWRRIVTQTGPLYIPTVVNITNGPTITSDDNHVVVRSLSAPPSDDGVTTRYVPVRVTFDPVTLHTRTHPGVDDVPTTLDDALVYPYFLPVSLCENEGCMDPREQWARDALSGNRQNQQNTTSGVGGPTTPSTPVLRVVNGGQDPSGSKVTIVEFPPLPGPAGPIGMIGLMGEPGPKGDTGDMGPMGPIGVPGLRGGPGFPGIPGETGDPGMTGRPATEGLPGPAGPAGLTGETGERGEKGIRGDSGVTKEIKAQSVGSKDRSPCQCDGLVNGLLVLGLIIWAILLTLLVVLLLVVAAKKVKASNDR